MQPMGGGGHGIDGREVKPEGFPEVGLEHFELAVGDGFGEEQGTAGFMDQRHALELGRHGGEQAVDVFLADSGTGFTVDFGLAGGPEVRDLIHAALGAEKGFGDFFLGAHEGDTQVAGEEGGGFIEGAVEEMPSADPAVQLAFAQGVEGRDHAGPEEGEGIIRQGLGQIKHATTDASAFE